VNRCHRPPPVRPLESACQGSKYPKKSGCRLEQFLAARHDQRCRHVIANFGDLEGGGEPSGFAGRCTCRLRPLRLRKGPRLSVATPITRERFAPNPTETAGTPAVNSTEASEMLSLFRVIEATKEAIERYEKGEINVRETIRLIRESALTVRVASPPRVHPPGVALSGKDVRGPISHTPSARTTSTLRGTLCPHSGQVAVDIRSTYSGLKLSSRRFIDGRYHDWYGRSHFGHTTSI
jgi:hypothetical protein